MTLNPESIQRYASALSRIRSYDSAIQHFGNRLSTGRDLGHLGTIVIDQLGRNILDLRSEDVGKVVLCATINALLDKRREAVADLDGAVDVPPPPCPKQVWDAEADA